MTRFVALRFAGGQVAHLWMSVIPRVFGPRMRVVGARGVYEKDGLDPQEPQLAAGLRPGAPGYGVEPREAVGRLATEVDGVTIEGHVESADGAYDDYYAGMRDAIRDGAPVPVDPARVARCHPRDRVRAGERPARRDDAAGAEEERVTMES